MDKLQVKENNLNYESEMLMNNHEIINPYLEREMSNDIENFNNKSTSD